MPNYRTRDMSSAQNIIDFLKTGLNNAIDRLASQLADGGAAVQPSSTRDAQVGDLLSDDVLSQLSPAAQRISKSDLLSFWNGSPTPAIQRITLNDMKVIKTAFWKNFEAMAPGMRELNHGGDCCCCSAAVASNPRPLD